MIEILKENKSQKKNEEDIGNVFSKKGETEKNTGTNKITEGSAFEKYEVG